MVRGPKDARSLTNAYSHANGQRTLSWNTQRGKLDTIEYRTYPRKVPMSSTEPLVYQCWQLLMSKVEVILKPPAGAGDNALEENAREMARQQARGVAQTLAILMQPFMADTDAVVKAAVKKYKDPDYEVPGLGEHLWDPMKNPDGSWRTPVAEPKAKPVARPKPKVDNSSTKTLTAEEAEGVREAIKSGMFSEAEIASMFKVSVATVKQAVSG